MKLKVKEKENLWHSEEELAQQNLSLIFYIHRISITLRDEYKKNEEMKGKKTILKHRSCQLNWKDVKFPFQLHQDAPFIILLYRNL